MNIAEKIIEKCGGVRATAELAGCTENWVRKWTYPKEKGGRGGFVPHDDATRIIANARANGLDLAPDDFFDIPHTPEGSNPAR